jgi:DNA-binding transcriptional MerR regulator
MKAVYGVSDAARYLGVSKSKLATWSERTGVGQRSDGGCYLYSDDDLKALEVIRALRDEDRSFDTIVRRIRPIGASAPALQPVTPEMQSVDDAADAGATTSLVAAVTAAVTAAVGADRRMGDRYAQAMQRLCDLKWEVRQLHDERSLLLTTHRSEGDALRAEIATLQADLAAERARPWWRKLFGRP